MMTNGERNTLAKQILNYNRKRLYKLPQKFQSLQEVLTPPLQDFLLDIIAFWLKVDCIAYGTHNMVYFLGTQKGTYTVRKKTTKSVTNKYINYLCAIGLLTKVKQKIANGYDGGRERRYFHKNVIAKININLLKYDKNYSKQPLNTFELNKYTTEFLENCNTRAKRLLDAKITSGNISYNQLAINGLEDIAKEIYLESRDAAVAKKEREYKKLVKCMDFLIEQYGYTTKQEIYNSCLLEPKEIDKLFKIFKNELWKQRTYKTPSKEEKEKYNLKDNKWIIITK